MSKINLQTFAVTTWAQIYRQS